MVLALVVIGGGWYFYPGNLVDQPVSVTNGSGIDQRRQEDDSADDVELEQEDTLDSVQEEVLHSFTTDDSFVYYFNEVVAGIDPATFAYISGYYFADGGGLDFFSDASGVYVIEPSDPNQTPHLIQEADVVSFRHLGGLYFKDDNNSYYINDTYYMGNDILDVDVTTFDYIGRRYARDKDKVLFDGEILEFADTTTFEYLGGAYAKDNENVYYGGGIVDSLDKESVEFLGESKVHLAGDYLMDKNGVYRSAGSSRVSVLPVDLETFVYLDDDYYKDKENVFYFDERIEEADSGTFERIGDIYAKDNSKVYYGKEIVGGADTETFEWLGYPYAKDKKNVYRFGDIVSGADPETFVVPSS